MINVDAIKELIDQAPEIKTLFTTESYPVASMYDYNTGTHKTSSIDLQTIYKNPVFLQWKDRVCFELAKIEGDASKMYSKTQLKISLCEPSPQSDRYFCHCADNAAIYVHVHHCLVVERQL